MQLRRPDPMPFIVRTLLSFLSLALSGVVAAEPRPEHMVYLRTIDPGIEQDIRYASAHNFTGHPLEGYEAPECLLSQDAAKALARVQMALRAQGYGLKVFDCYRPTRAVADMGRFATEPGDPRKAEFYPRVDKQDFWRLGYVARVSNHSKGGTVDLSMTGPGALPADTADIQYRARQLTEDVAIALQAKLLLEAGNSAVSDAFIGSRLGDGGRVYGTLPRGVEVEALLARATPHLA